MARRRLDVEEGNASDNPNVLVKIFRMSYGVNGVSWHIGLRRGQRIAFQ